MEKGLKKTVQTNRRQGTANAKLVGGSIKSRVPAHRVTKRKDVVFTVAQRGPGTGSPQRAEDRKHILFTEAFNGQNQPAESHSHHGPLCCRNKVSKHNTSLLSPEPRGASFPRRDKRARPKMGLHVRYGPTKTSKWENVVLIEGRSSAFMCFI